MRARFTTSIATVALIVVATGQLSGQAVAPVATASSAHPAVPAFQAAPLTGDVRLDGRLDDAAWTAATPATTFTQLDPDEGRPPSERTEVRVLVSGDAI